MTALAALVADLQARGVTLEPRGDRLAVRPVSRLTPDELAVLRHHKSEVLHLLARGPAPASPATGRLAASWLLDDRTGQPISLVDFYRVRRFRLRGCTETFWFAKDETVLAQRLAKDEVDRGRVWLEDELIRTLLLPTLTEAGLRELGRLKRMFDGVVAPVPTAPPPNRTGRGPRPARRRGDAPLKGGSRRPRAAA